MWSLVFVYLFVGAAVADNNQQNAWKSGTQYQYQVQGRTLAALHQVADQYTGILMRAKLTVQAKSDNTIQAELSRPQYAQIHTQLPGGWDSDIPESRLNYQELPLSSKPFELKLKNGAVHDLIVDKNLPTWEVNMLKSIASQLQVDTQGENLIKSKYNQEPEGDQANAVYKTMEDSVTGKCEVLYDISPLPQYILQSEPELAPMPELQGDGQMIDIVKTKNFSNCEERIGYHFGFSGMTDWEPGTNDNGRFLSKSSVSRIVISGKLNRYAIQSSVTTNKVILSPNLHEGQNGIVVSRLNLTLSSVSSASNRISSPSNPQSAGNLVYSYSNQRSPNCNDESNESSSSSSSSSDEDRAQNKHSRNRRAARRQESSSSSSSGSSSSSSSSSSSEEDFHQPKPTLNDAPQIPMMPYFVGYKGNSIQQSEQVDPVKAAQKLANQIGNELQNPNNIPKKQTLEKFTILASLLRTMDKQQIAEAQKSLYQSAPETDSNDEKQSARRNAWVAFRDAVAQAGTGPALVNIKEWIERKQIQGVEAAEVVAALPKSSRTPTPEYMKAFFSLATNSAVKKQAYLNSTAILAFTELLREAQVDNNTAHNRFPVHSFGRLSPKGQNDVSQEYIPYLAKELKNAVQQAESPKIQTYIRALGNVGHPKILAVLEPYLEGQEEASDFQRLMMVASLDKLAMLYPKAAGSVLYKIYQNTGETHEVRCAAVFQLMRTNPPASILQRMAEFTNHDSSNHVNAAVKSAIESAAELDTYEQRELAHNARAARNLLNPETQGLQYSQSYLKDYAAQEINLAYKLSFNYIGSEDSVVPQAYNARLGTNIGGYKSLAAEAAAMVSSIEDLSNVFAQQAENRNERGNQKRKQSGGNSGKKQWSPENLAKMLNFEADDAEQLEGQLYLNTKAANRFFAFDNHTINRIPSLLKDAADSLKQGESFNLTKFSSAEMTLSFPTEMGLPFVFTLKAPTLLNIGGEAQAQSNPEITSRSSNQIRAPNTVNATADINIVYSAKVQSRMGFIAPFEHQSYIAGVDKNFQINLPIRSHIDYDAENQHVRVKLQPIQQDKDINLVHYSTKPFTAKHDILDLSPVANAKNSHTVHVRKPNDYEKIMGEKTTGMVVRLEATSEADPLQDFYEWANEEAQQHDAISAMAFPWAQQNIHANEYNLIWDSRRSNAQAVIVTGSYDSYTSSRKNRGQESNDENSSEGPSANAPQPSDQKPDSQRRRQQLLMEAASGITDAEAAAVDLGVKFQGQSGAQYAATFAYASSNVDDLSRALFYYSHNTAQQRHYEASAAIESEMPNVPELDFHKALKTESSGKFDAEIRYGENSKAGAKINIQGKLKQSGSLKEYLRNSPMAQQCAQEMEHGDKALPACQNVTERANIMNKARISVKYQNVPDSHKNMVAQALSFAQVQAFPNANQNTIDPQPQKKNQIDIDVEVSPDNERVNVSMNAPTLDANFTNIQIPSWAQPILAVHPAQSAAERLAQNALAGDSNPTCVIDNNNANTFDNKTYPIELGQCWHVFLATVPQDDPDNYRGQLDIPEDMSVSVVGRDTSDNEKEVKITLGENEIKFSPSGSQPQVQVNGRKINPSQQQSHRQQQGEDETAFEVFQLPDGSVKMTSDQYGIDAVYDGARVKISVANKYRNSIRGLCGDLNGEESTEFTSPQNCVLKKPEHFAASYALTEQDCQGPAPQNARNAAKANCSRKETHYGNVISDQQAGRPRSANSKWGNSRGRNNEDRNQKNRNQKNQKSEDSHEYRTKVVDEGHEICFSLRPVPTCAHGFRATEMQQKDIKMHCVAKSNAAKKLAKRIEAGATPDLSHKSVTKILSTKVAVSCKA